MAFVILLSVGGAVFYLALAMVIEAFAPRSRFSLAPLLPSIALALANTALIAIVQVVVNRAMADVPALLVSPGITEGVFAVCGSILFADLAIYWLHRAQHNFFWRFHVVHHSPRDLHASAGVLTHPVEVAIRALFVSVPLALAGIHSPAIPFALAAVIRLHEFYLHSPTTMQLGPLSKIVINSRFHRIHHSLDENHFDRNFGVLFTFWDHLFGTATVPEPSQWPDVGVPGVEPARGLRDMLAMPFASLRRSGSRAIPTRSIP